MIVTGLDIGSLYIKAVLCNVDENNEIKLIGSVKTRYKGAKNGTIIDLEKTKEAINITLNKLKTLNESNPSESCFVGISGKGISSFTGSASIALWEKDGETHRSKVTKKHIDKVIHEAKLSYITENKTILHSIPQAFQIDDQAYTLNPIAMTGVKLKGDVYVIQLEKTQLENMGNLLKECSIDNYHLIYSPIASCEAIIDDDDKETGVVVVNFGGGCTEIGIYQDGILKMVDSIPFGSDYITKDLRIMLKVDMATAENIKIKTGISFLDDTLDDEKIEIQLNETSSSFVKRNFVAKIIAARTKEIYEMIIKKIYDGSYQRKIHSPIILTGPGMNLSGADKFFDTLSNSKSVKRSVCGINLNSQTDDNNFYTALGLVKHGISNGKITVVDNYEGDDKELSGWDKFKNFVKDLF